jgi:Domain of unknown function (DUF4159)/Prenyltransferase and squalene oxidase repeat
MQARVRVVGLFIALALWGGLARVSDSRGADASPELSSARVKESIERVQKYLGTIQNADGSFGFRSAGLAGYYGNTGVTGLVVLSLLSSGLPPDQAVVAKGLRFLRTAQEPQGGFETYQCSVMLMALAAAKQERDSSRIQSLAHRLESFQILRGARVGMWNYGRGLGSEDNSNTQFALLALREAAVSKAPIHRRTWELAEAHYIETQNRDGGWGYHIGQPSTGSMTCSGIGSLQICEQMLDAGEDDLNPDGTPKCCNRTPHSNRALRRGVEWLGRHFAVGVNPGEQGGIWPLYFLYGVERAGRLSARRFFGPHDWYREGAAYFVDRQTMQDGSFIGTTAAETDPVIASSFALLFLSKGLAPVLINKLSYDVAAEVRKVDDDTLPNWNLHPNDVRNLTEFTSSLPHWPKLLTYQEVDLEKLLAQGGVRDLLQAPILYISGISDPKFSDGAVQLLRAYVEQGGFIFAVNNCNGSGFDDGIRSLAARIYASGDAQLKRLPPEHPIYRAEYALDPGATELWGVDFGCRTSFVYSPQDHSCLWDKWSMQRVAKRTAQFNLLLLQSMKVGVNVVAYATGREPYDKLDAPPDEITTRPQNQIERGLLQVAKLRHTGDWDAAPRALHNVLIALNRTSGLLASMHQKNLVATDDNLRSYPLAYMHGRSSFQFSPQEIAKLREYLNGGAVLFADACCGSPQFDQSFRNLVQQLFPNQKLERIPITHELFSQGIGFPIRKVMRRIPQSSSLAGPLDPTFHEGEPFLEGIQIKGRYCVIYSKYDLSCAIERQASVVCAGYDHHDAVKIAVNVIRYALLQDISYANKIR